jgi:hypothetical protein
MDDELLFQHYLVVFFDHLGQREHLRKITELPTTDPEKQEFINIMKTSVGRILNIRSVFKNYFDAANSYTPNLNLVTPEHRKEFAASQKTDLNFYGISDSVIIAVPLMSNDENCTAINGVFSAFVATCGIGLMSLSIQVAMRAGLDVGVATQIDDNEIYGPALERAFYLESKLAEYSRFIVGNELINYLRWVEHQESTTKLSQVAKGLAKYCREMIIQDSDGRYMLDFLGDKMKESSRDVINVELVKSALDFVKSQYEKYSKEENEKLASRYFRLLLYFYSRKSAWGLN